MSRAWIFQGNPKSYDIDGALSKLSSIWWRAPQHTDEIHAGDVAVLWRSGPDAGVVGVARVLSEPQQRGMDPQEHAFVRAASETPTEATRVLLEIRGCALVSKDVITGLPAFAEHRLLRAPLGTVFSVSDAQWNALAPLLPDPPPRPEVTSAAELPEVWAWKQRAKGAMAMPGGYTGYVASLERICDVIAEERPTAAELDARLCEMFNIAMTGARLRVQFLRRSGYIELAEGLFRLSDWTRRWRESDDLRIVVALFHGRYQYVGELLAALTEPKSTDDLLAHANEEFGMSWDTPAQVSIRRGWLQSCGLLEVTSQGEIVATESGRSLLGQLVLHQPTADLPTNAGEPTPTDPVPVIDRDLRTTDDVDKLIEKLRSSATDSSNPIRLEQATRDAFEFLGFRAEWLGGSGKTDVLLDAMLGDEAYRVVVDSKTTGSGSLGDHQIDWVTLAEHRAKHDADYVAVVGPKPTGSRLFQRAAEQTVAVISVERLVGLCSQHARTPLTLDDYRGLFSSGGEPPSESLDERSTEVDRWMNLTHTVVRAIDANTSNFGRLTARDLVLLLAAGDIEGVTQEDVQVVLDALSSPLADALDGDVATGYRLRTSIAVARRRLELLGSALSSRSARRDGTTTVDEV